MDIIDDDQYQDIRVKGQTVYYGRRECESRYNSIKPFLDRFNKEDSFRVLDFGANYGYFSWRIKEDFPNAIIDIVDRRPLLKLLADINDYSNITLFSEDWQYDDIVKHREGNYYDVIMLMSILHHFNDYDRILDAFLNMGDNIIVETDYPDKQNFTDSSKEVYEYVMSKNPIQLNSWLEHDRPIYYINDNEFGLNGIVASGSNSNNMGDINIILNWLNAGLFEGTFNVYLEKEIGYNNILLVYETYSIIKCYLFGYPVLLIRDILLNPTKSNFIELISPEHLRSKFNLKDGDKVIISFCKNVCEWGNK